MKRGFIEKDNNAYLATTRLPRLRLAMTATRGFTLIELLVVVLIIGILAAVALPQYRLAVKKSQAMTLLPLGKKIVDAEHLYYLANNSYTIDFNELDVSMPAGGDYRPNTGSAVMNYPNYFIRIAENGKSSRIEFGDKTSYMFIWYFEGKLYCYADKDDNFQHRLCKALGGIFSWDAGSQVAYRLSF